MQMQNQYMIKAEYFDRKNAYAHLEEMVSMDEALLEDVPEDMRPQMPFTKADAMAWKNRAGARLARPINLLACCCENASQIIDTAFS